MSLEKYSDLPKLDGIFAHLTYAPGYTSETHSGGIQGYFLEQQIDAFARSYQLWVISFAEKLAEMPDSGFAILTVLNAYPEMIAQLHGIQGNKSKLFQNGILMVFPELRGEYEVDICNHLYAYLRSGIAHMGLTSFNIILSGDVSHPIIPGTYRNSLAIVINPKEWLDRVNAHFHSYIDALKNKNDNDLRAHFSARLSKPF